MNTTALVHEAYLRLVDQTRATYRDRHHFFAVAARAMRQIVVDYARRRRAQKRGGGQVPFELREDLDSPLLQPEEQAEALLALDLALNRLAALDPRLVRVVELRFFGGLSVEETAEVLAVSTPTIKRDTRAARAFLYQEMQKHEA
jgi:RNA polymerase sigma factor (TIGR02999 family)